jgi:acetyl-CoA carboxylase carboxyl transferase subunit alpha
MSTFYQLEFEKPVVAIENEIKLTQQAIESPGVEVPALGGVNDGIEAQGIKPNPADLELLEKRRIQALKDVYKDLSPWNTVRVARHPNRPQTRDYIEHISRDFCELHGDRAFADDPALITGFGRIGNRKCLIVGHQKGKTTQEKLACHFGCAHPEGYRKALAKMRKAEKFGLPIVTLVDTPGAYPGLGKPPRDVSAQSSHRLHRHRRRRVRWRPRHRRRRPRRNA